MNVSGINQAQQPVTPQKPLEGSKQAASEIRELEQQLQKLDAEKQKAVRNKDTERERKLEKQIQEIKKQIEQLKSRETNRQEEEAEPGNIEKKKSPENAGKGKYIDEIA